MKDRTRPQIVVQEGEAWYRTASPQSQTTWSYFGGTETAADILWARFRALETLQHAGALLAHVPMSDAIERGTVQSAKRVGGGAIEVAFRPPHDVGLTRSDVRVVYDRATGHLRGYSIVAPKRQLGFVVSESSTRAAGAGLFEIRVSSKSNGQYGSTLESERLISTVLDVQPIKEPPNLFKPPNGDRVLDAAVESFFVVGTSTKPLDPYLARETLAAARQGYPSVFRKPDESEALRCGPDALYYVLKLKGISVETDLLLEKFPDIRMGASIAQLVAGARALGHTSRAVSSANKDIRSIQVPAISQVRPSHFVVLVGMNPAGDAVWISPPHEVRVTHVADLVKMWTGRAMWLD